MPSGLSSTIQRLSPSPYLAIEEEEWEENEEMCGAEEDECGSLEKE